MFYSIVVAALSITVRELRRPQYVVVGVLSEQGNDPEALYFLPFEEQADHSSPFHLRCEVGTLFNHICLLGLLRGASSVMNDITRHDE